jgi:prepilin-type N-terminal cleavage/methylation domain-containing protein
MKLHTQRGMTLLEVLVAMAVFGLLLGVIMVMMQQSSELGQNSKRFFKAQLRATEVMESMRALPFEELWSSPEPVIFDAKPWAAEVVMTDFHESPSLKKIVVSVRWKTLQGQERSYRLETLRSRFKPVYIKPVGSAINRLAKGGSE